MFSSMSSATEKTHLRFFSSPCSVTFLSEDSASSGILPLSYPVYIRVNVSLLSLEIESIKSSDYQTTITEPDHSHGLDETSLALLSAMRVLLKASVELWLFMNHQCLARWLHLSNTSMLAKTTTGVNAKLRSSKLDHPILMDFVDSSRDCETVDAYCTALSFTIRQLLTRVELTSLFRREDGRAMEVMDDNPLPMFPTSPVSRVRGQLVEDLVLMTTQGPFNIPRLSFIEVFSCDLTNFIAAYTLYQGNSCLLQLSEFEVSDSSPVHLRTPSPLQNEKTAQVFDCLSLICYSALKLPSATLQIFPWHLLRSKAKGNDRLSQVVEEFIKETSQLMTHLNPVKSNLLFKLLGKLAFSLIIEKYSFVGDPLFDNVRIRSETQFQSAAAALLRMQPNLSTSIVIETIQELYKQPPNICAKLPSFKEVRSRETTLADSIFDVINESSKSVMEILDSIRVLFASIDCCFLDVLTLKVSLLLCSLIDVNSVHRNTGVRDIIQSEFQNNYQHLIHIVECSFSETMLPLLLNAAILKQIIGYLLLIRLSTPRCYCSYPIIGSVQIFDSSLFEPLDSAILEGGCCRLVLPPVLADHRDEGNCSTTVIVKGRALPINSSDIIVHP